MWRCMATPRGTTSPASFLGSGIRPAWYLGLLAGTVALFLVWGGPLWQTDAFSSHLGRFLVSYLVVVPLVAILLRFEGGLSRTHFVTAVGTLWAIKLVITAPLYFALGPRGGMFGRPGPRPSQPSKRVASAAAMASAESRSRAERPYEAATGSFEHGTLQGMAQYRGVPLSGAVVQLVAPGPGAAVEAADVSLSMVATGGFDDSHQVAFVGANLLFRNAAEQLKIVFMVASDGEQQRTPVAPKGQAQVELGDTGWYALSQGLAGTAAARTTAVVAVVDHPYWARCDSRGAFELNRVPAGPTPLRILALHDGAILTAVVDVEVPPGGRATVKLSPQVYGERQ